MKDKSDNAIINTTYSGVYFCMAFVLVHERKEGGEDEEARKECLCWV